MTTPDMGPASAIDDPRKLWERIGYRTWLAWRSGAPSPLYDGFNGTDLRRLAALLPAEGSDSE